MDSPTTAILTDSPALHSLKRPQLLALCKQHNLKGNGKNTELIERLQAHGELLGAGGAGDEDVVMDTSDVIEDDWSHVSPSAIQMEGQVFEQTHGITPSVSTNSIASTLKNFVGSLKKVPSQGSLRKVPSFTSLREPPLLRSPSTTTDNADMSLTSPALSIRQVEISSGGCTSSSPQLMIPAGTTYISHLPPLSPVLPSTRDSFIFGSPSASTALFTFGTSGGGGTAMEKMRDEMNARLSANRAANGGMLSRSGSMVSLNGGVGGGLKSSLSASGGFEGKHKRDFEKMDSIANHYAAHRSASSTNLASLSRSTSQRALNTSVDSTERPMKRLKAPEVEQAEKVVDQFKKGVHRKLEMSKARRNSVKTTAGRFAMGKVKNMVSKVAPIKSLAPPQPIASSSKSTISRPLPTISRPTRPLPSTTAPNHTFGSAPSRTVVAAPGSVKKQPSWKKFDLAASLAKGKSAIKASTSAPGKVTNAGLSTGLKSTTGGKLSDASNGKKVITKSLKSSTSDVPLPKRAVPVKPKRRMVL